MNKIKGIPGEVITTLGKGLLFPALVSGIITTGSMSYAEEQNRILTNEELDAQAEEAQRKYEEAKRNIAQISKNAASVKNDLEAAEATILETCLRASETLLKNVPNLKEMCDSVTQE